MYITNMTVSSGKVPRLIDPPLSVVPASLSRRVQASGSTVESAAGLAGQATQAAEFVLPVPVVYLPTSQGSHGSGGSVGPKIWPWVR